MSEIARLAWARLYDSARASWGRPSSARERLCRSREGGLDDKQILGFGYGLPRLPDDHAGVALEAGGVWRALHVSCDRTASALFVAAPRQPQRAAAGFSSGMRFAWCSPGFGPLGKPELILD